MAEPTCAGRMHWQSILNTCTFLLLNNIYTTHKEVEEEEEEEEEDFLVPLTVLVSLTVLDEVPKSRPCSLKRELPFHVSNLLVEVVEVVIRPGFRGLWGAATGAGAVLEGGLVVVGHVPTCRRGKSPYSNRRDVGPVVMPV